MGLPGNNLEDNSFMNPNKPKEPDNAPEGMGGVCEHDWVLTHVGPEKYVNRCVKCGMDKS